MTGGMPRSSALGFALMILMPALQGGNPMDAIFAQVRKASPDAREYFLAFPENKAGTRREVP